LVDSRVVLPSAWIEHDGKREYSGSISADPALPGFNLGLPDCDEVKSTARGRFLGTAKLFCANLEVFLIDIPPGMAKHKPII
jgi:hypothetical protein